jgi:hypothetical protein
VGFGRNVTELTEDSMVLDIGFLFLLFVWSFGVGLALLVRFDSSFAKRPGAIALAVPLGLGTLALIGLGLGELGALGAWGLSVVGSLGVGLGAAHLWRSRDAFAAQLRLSQVYRERFGVNWLFALPLAVTLLGTFLTALAPVTDGDALCYHLQVPKVFLERGTVFFDPDLHETVYPLLTEMLYAVALTFRGPVACRLVQWLLGVVFAANVSALARPTLGPRAWWAGTIALLAPAISNGMGAPLNDVALAALGTATLVAWSRFREQPSASGAVLTGVFCGLSLGVKYPALVLTGLIGAAILIEILRRPPWIRASVRFAALFAVTAIAVGGSWYLRAWTFTGNPVYPFFRHRFGGSGFDEVLDPVKRPMAVSLWNLATALGPLTLHPERFDSFSHQFGPVFLLFLPALLLERAPGRVVGLAAIGYAFLMLCLTQRQSMRFVLIALGPLSVAVAWLAAGWCDRGSVPARCLVGLLLVALGFEATIALARARHGLRVVAGRESAAQYLDRREPTFRVGRWVATNLPPPARLIGQDHRGYYFPCGYTMELAHRRRTGLGRQGESAAEIVARLLRAGFTHVLFCPPIPECAVEFDPTLERLLAPWLKGRQPLFRDDISDADGVVRRYRIYDLSPSLAAHPEGGLRR